MFKLAKEVALTCITVTAGIGLVIAVYTAPYWISGND